MRLKRFNIKREEKKLNKRINSENSIRLRTIILSIFILAGSIMLFTYSKYSATIKLDIMHSKVGNFLQDDYIINAYVDGDEDDFPGKNDGYIVDEVVCNKGATGTWDDDEWGLLITGATEEETECSVYFMTPFDSIDFTFDSDNDGSGQEFIVPVTGNYKIELWGAQGGGTSSYPGGKGAYTSGNIQLNKNDHLYVYVGEYNSTTGSVVFNNGTSNGLSNPGYVGGGSTDVRLVGGEWNDFDSLKTRIMVAAAGSGAQTYYCSYAGVHAGGLTGYDGQKCGSNGRIAKGGTQTSAGQNGGVMGNYDTPALGSLGLPSSPGSSMSRGGNGWYPGGHGPHHSGTVGTGGSGSSFISGYSGCNAIDIDNSTSSNIIHKGNSTTSYNGRNYVFTNMSMIDGKGCNWSTGSASNCGANQPQPDGTNKAGHEGNGIARITLIERN